MYARDLSCAELVELVTDYFEGAMDADRRTRFEEHLVYCQECVNYVEQMRRTIETVGHLSEESIEPAARDRLLQAFRDWKRG